ncbi:MAG: YrhK family protein [Acidithiobacillus sp.]
MLFLINDFMIGILFLVGSFFFFYPSMETTGVWLFVIGSAELLIRPSIRLIRQIQRVRRTYRAIL